MEQLYTAQLQPKPLLLSPSLKAQRRNMKSGHYGLLLFDELIKESPVPPEPQTGCLVIMFSNHFWKIPSCVCVAGTLEEGGAKRIWIRFPCDLVLWTLLVHCHGDHKSFRSRVSANLFT